jgi:light-harvesting complex 1 beta chain
MAGIGEKLNVSGLSDQEAKELHSGFMQMTILYVAIAVVAHVLVWLWRPWINV